MGEVLQLPPKLTVWVPRVPWVNSQRRKRDARSVVSRQSSACLVPVLGTCYVWGGEDRLSAAPAEVMGARGLPGRETAAAVVVQGGRKGHMEDPGRGEEAVRKCRLCWRRTNRLQHWGQQIP